MSAPLTWHNWANLVAYLVNSSVTYASLAGIFGGTNEELSAKYQVLVTPAGWAFSIWGPIFIWEGVFAIGQMTPQLRDSKVVRTMTGWWLSACAFQVAWTPFFAQEVIVVALICMLGILASLVCGILATDFLVKELNARDFWILRAPFSLHAGWIVAASLLNLNVYADSLKSSPKVMLAIAVWSFAAIAAIVVLFALAVPKGDPIICIVAGWALAAISANLSDPTDLQDRDRFNFYDWPAEVLDGLQIVAAMLSIWSFVFAAVAAGRRLFNDRLAASKDAASLPAWP